jgi:hypothetical protein
LKPPTLSLLLRQTLISSCLGQIDNNAQDRYKKDYAGSHRTQINATRGARL